MKQEFNGINYPIEFMRVVGVILITFTHIKHDFTDGLPYFILETLPRYGTLLLSVISGYLFCMNPGENILNKKIKSLLIPFLIANIAVIIPVVAINLMGYNYLNRLDYDYKIITEGLLSLNMVPINPPTYFIRDLFIIFCVIDLIKRNFYTLLFIIPLLIFGHLFLRWDIPVLFMCGFLIKKYSIEDLNKFITNGIGIGMLIAVLVFFKESEYHRHIVAILLFINIVTLKFKFYRTGGYTYLLHLYHTPVMIFLFPLLHAVYPSPYFEAIAQIVLAATLCYLGYLIIRKLNWGIITGSRV